MEANRLSGILLSAPPRLRIDPCLHSIGNAARRFPAWLLLLLLSSSSLAQNHTINRTQPLALAPGATTSLALIGERIVPGGTLWTSFPAQISAAESMESNPVFRITLRSNLPPAIGAVRVANSNGVSNLQLVMIDPLPSVAATGTNFNPGRAQRLKLPVAVDGKCDELQSHFYRVELRRRERVVIEAVANRMGSLLDPFVRVLDDHGHELASADDTPGCAADARLEFIAPKSESYLIEIRDTRYAGGPDHFYRLRVGDFGVVPLQFLPLAESLPCLAQVLPVVSTRESNVQSTGAAGVTRPQKSRYSKIDDSGPGKETAPHTIHPPALIRGRLDSSNSRDVYEFATGKDERWIIHGRTRSLGSPCDLYLRLERPDGSLLVEADATGADEGSLTNRAGDAGTTRLVVEELNHGGGPEFDYEIEIMQFEPGFTLSSTTNSVEAAPGGTFELKVNAVRRDYDGPITLSLVGLGVGFSLTNQVIAEKQTANTMTAKLPATLNSAKLINFTVIGIAEVKGKRIESCASTMPALKARFPQMLYPPRELDGLMWLGVKAESTSPK